MKSILFSFFISFFVFTTLQVDAQDSTFTKLWDNGKLKEEGNYVNESKDGIWKRWNQKGELTELNHYSAGALKSKVTFEYYLHTPSLLYKQNKYDSLNHLVEERNYIYKDNDVYDVVFYNNEIKISDGKMIKGKKDGKWTYYNQDGSVKEVKKYIEGVDTEEIRESNKINKDYTPVEPSKENAIIKIYRPKANAGANMYYELHINDSNVVDVINGLVYEYEITQEDIYELTINSVSDKVAKSSFKIKLDVKLGRTYFLKCELLTGGEYSIPSMKIVNPTKGLSEFNRLKEI
ncbi:MAG: hypothetical protein CMD31_10220 [Flavobacteriales bacterium]|nr:hypothetical protein [Flavobacteriales bacterium]|tara:strand:+ start:47716 stop:48588 length:873 start_codon:yes stop_codon:yes gene_type:complete